MKKNLRLVHDNNAAPEPDLSGIPGYKGVWALCTVSRQTGRLTATHYAICLVMGKDPFWGVWHASGKFARYAGSRTQIERAYPKLVWRRKMAKWSLVDVDDTTAKKRREILRKEFTK